LSVNEAALHLGFRRRLALLNLAPCPRQQRPGFRERHLHSVFQRLGSPCQFARRLGAIPADGQDLLIELGPRLQVFQFFISEIARNSASGLGANGYQQEGLLAAKARFLTILRHTNIATNKVAGLG
jgi:hypothetical protein